jgi:hypothetical protein
VTWRAVLQDMIVDTVSGKFEKPNSLSLSGHEWEAFKLQLGLYEQTYQLQRDFISRLSRARMLYKDPQKAAVQDRYYRLMLRRMNG